MQENVKISKIDKKRNYLKKIINFYKKKNAAVLYLLEKCLKCLLERQTNVYVYVPTFM